MKKMKKITAILLTLIMLLSSMGSIAFADDALTVNYFNADSSKIVIGFSNEVSVESLTNAISITNGGAAVTDFTITQKTNSTTAVGTLIEDTDYTYFVTLTNGLKLDSPYKVTIASGLASSDASVVLAETYEKSFIVEKIWKEDFEGYSDENPSPWMMWASDSTYTNSLVTDDNGDTSLVTTVKKDGVMPNPNLTTGTFADTGKSVNAYFSDSATKAKLKDYTLEAKVKIADPPSYTSHGQGVALSMQNYVKTTTIREYYNRFTYTPLIAGGFSGYTYDNGVRALVVANNPSNGTTNAKTNAESLSLTFVDSKGALTTTPKKTVFTCGNVEQSISLSVKGENIKVAGGANGGFVSYDYDTTAVAISNYSFPVVLLYGGCSCCTRTYTLDDIIATKMKEIIFDDVNVTYFNADSSKIIVDLDKEVDADLLKSAITLKKDDVEIADFTVTKKTPSTDVAGTLTVDGSTTYFIVPADGITVDDSVYSVSIDANITDGVNVYSLPEDFNKSFKVETIWKENFEGYSDENPNPWVMWKSGSTRVPSLTTTNGDTELTVTANKDGIMPSPTLKTGTFADTGKSVNAYFSDSATKAKLKNYTLEAKIKINFSTCTWSSHGQGAGLFMVKYNNTTDFNNYYNKKDYTSLIAGGFWGYTYAAGVQSFVAVNNPSNGAANAKTNGTLGYTIDGSTGALNTKATTNIFDRDGKEQSISLSVVDDNIKVAGGSGNGFVNYNYDTTAVVMSDYSFPVVFLKGCDGGHTMDYSIDDIIATKMSEVVLEKVNVTYINADSSKIVVDLDKEVDADLLKSAITLKKDGTNVSDFTVTKKTRSTNTAGTLTVDNNTTYFIVPADGITLNSVYSFVINKEITDGANLYKLPKEFKKVFKVEKIWEEDFEGYSDENPNPWVMWKSGSTRTPVLTTTNGDTELTVTAGNDGIMPSPTLTTGSFADTGKSVNAYFGDSATKAKLKNYTLEAKIKINFSTCTYSSHGQGAGLFMVKYANTTDFNNYYNKKDYTSLIAGGFWGYTYDKGVQAFVAVNNPSDGVANAKTNGSLGYTIDGSTGALTDTPTKNVFDRDGKEQSISLSVLDGNIKVAGGSSNGFVSYNYDTTAVAISDYSFPVVFLKGCSGGHTMDYSIDDIIATRMVETEEVILTYGELIIDNGEEEIDSIVGEEYIYASVEITNMTGTDKPCKVILAIFGSDDSLKAISLSETETIPANDSEYIYFDDVEVNGGVTCKVFCWDDFNNLTPYFRAINWPE